MANANDVRMKTPTISLGGEVYTLRFDFNAWADIEEAYGSTNAAIEALQKAQDLNGKTMTVLRHFLWAGMAQDAPELTLKDVGRMLSFENMGELLANVTAAVTGSLGEGEDTGE